MGGAAGTLVVQLVAAGGVAAVGGEAAILAPGALGHCRVERQRVGGGRAVGAAPRAELVALVAALLLAALPPDELHEGDEQVLARRLARRRATVNRSLREVAVVLGVYSLTVRIPPEAAEVAKA